MRAHKQLSPFILTADIGGSHITTAVYDLTHHAIIADTVTRAKVHSKGTSGSILSVWSETLMMSAAKSPLAVSALAIAMPGPFDYENGISYITGRHKYESLYGLNIRGYLAESLALDASRIIFRNDAESAIAGESFAGAGEGAQSVLGITLGTGFGAAIFQNSVTKDLNLGSLPFKDSIADDYFSSRWFLRRYFEMSGFTLTDGVRELAALAAKCKTSLSIFDEFSINLSHFLEQVIKTKYPEKLIICGNIANASPYFLPALRETLPIESISLGVLGEHAALLGAAVIFE